MTILLSYELPDLSNAEEKRFKTHYLDPLGEILSEKLGDFFGKVERKIEYNPLNMGQLNPEKDLYIPLFYKPTNSQRFQGEFRHFGQLGIPALILLKSGLKTPPSYVPIATNNNEAPKSRTISFDTIEDLEKRISTIQGREFFFKDLELERRKLGRAA